MTKGQTLTLGLIELGLLAVLFAAGYTSHLPDLSRTAAILIYGALVLGGIDGMFRIVDVMIWPSNAKMQAMRRFYLVAFGGLIPALLLDEYKIVPFLKSGAGVLAVASIYLGTALPVWLVEHPRIQWLRDSFGDTGIRVLYIGFGVLILGLAIFSGGLSRR